MRDERFEGGFQIGTMMFPKWPYPPNEYPAFRKRVSVSSI
jgi:hypothetical protein